jgi:hypothetical protein
LRQNSAARATNETGAAMLARTVTTATIVALGLVSIAPPSSFAQEIDMKVLNCGDFVKSSQEAVTKIMLWLSGYFTYEDDLPIIDLSKIANKENQLKQYCTDNPLLPLLEASEIFMDKKYNKER